MTDYREYFNEVTQTLVDIEQWFSGTADKGVLTQLHLHETYCQG